MENFWDFSVWSIILLFGVLLGSLLGGNVLKRWIPFLRHSLIPPSVLGGAILIIVAAIYKAATGDVLFDIAAFGEHGTSYLETITYPTRALGCIASAFKPSKGRLTKKRTSEIFNTGVTTVSTYLLQGVCGMIISMIAALLVKGFFPAAGLLLPFGYGQGTGQALNYGGIYEYDFGFLGGKSFGLTIAALGFLSASFGGVAHLILLKRRGQIIPPSEMGDDLYGQQIQSPDESPMQESIDKLTVQIALIGLSYLLAYLLMMLLGSLLPGMKSVIYGFNFLLGVLTATLVKAALNFMRRKKMLRRDHTNSFLLTRASNFCFDIMVVAGIAAIRLSALEDYWGIILIMGVVGLGVTYAYNHFVAHTLFPEYPEEQFLMMFGMLTGTASTGTILLREIDSEFKTPASDNMVYQNFPAMVFGFPLMLLATIAPVRPVLVTIVLALFCLVMNVILFRSKIFKKKA